MALQFPPLVIPPRPPELPSVPPPTNQGEPFLRNDAFLSTWVEQFLRVIRDAWLKLGTLSVALEGRVGTTEERLTALETRIADTYTFGQKGKLTIRPADPVTLLALPLRVVRDEVLVEITMTAEVPPTDNGVDLIVQHNGDEVAFLSLNVGLDLTSLVLDPPRPLLKDDKLRVIISRIDVAGADVVCQIRCR